MPLTSLTSLLIDPSIDVVRALLRQLPEVGVILFDRELRIRLAEGSPIFAAGHRTELVRGRKLPDLATAGAYELIVGEYRAALAGERRTFELPSTLTGRHYGISVGPIRGADGEIAGGVAVVTDITEAARISRASAQAEAHFRLLAETATDVVSLHDVDGTYLWISPSITTVFGYQPEELVGRNAFDFVHPDDAPVLAAELEIDRSFVAGVCEREDDRAIVAAVVGMAGALRLGVIPRASRPRTSSRCSRGLAAVSRRGTSSAARWPPRIWRRRSPPSPPG